MKCIVELSEAEKKTLQQLSRYHPHADFRTRGLGLLLLESGRRVHEAALELEVSDKSVYNWMHAWHDIGIARLADADDPPVANADIAFHDAEFSIDDRRILDDDVQNAIRRSERGIVAFAVAKRFAGSDP